ncbi:MAG: hypothetical protein Kow0020_03610 [Wenzhouxiangellaceae bacterium]
MTEARHATETCRLEVRTDGGDDEAALVIALDGRDFPDGPGLERIGGDYVRECWRGDAGIDFIRLAEPDGPEHDAAETAYRLYSKLIRMLADSAHPCPLRLWNFFPAINHGEGDDERYRRFCLGRGRALDEAGLKDAQMCAATAIGTQGHLMQVVALVGALPGLSIENPRQVSAWNYPRDYGPRQPAFARATGIRLADGRAALLISGTASVIGHRTAHPNDVLAQADEAACNLDALLKQGAAILDRPGLARFHAHSLARVYLRNAADWPQVEARLRARWPHLQLCALKGDICRRDLMVEIEAWHCA